MAEHLCNVANQIRLAKYKMTYCFECRAELPGPGMIYCLSCSPCADDGELTICRSSAPAPQTFVGHMTAPRFDGQVSYPVVLAATLFIFFAVCAGLVGNMLPTSQDSAGGLIRPEDTREGGAFAPRPVKADRDPISKPAAILRSAKLERSSVPATAKKEKSMRTRIEIVDGRELCYAIPGGNEIPC